MCRLLVLVLPLILGRDSSAADPGSPKPRKLIILPKAGADLTKLRQAHQAKGHRLHRRFSELGGMEVVQLSGSEDIGQAIARYKQSGLVEFVEPDYPLHTRALPNDPFFSDGTQWSLQNTGQNGGTSGADIHAVNGWDALNSAEGVIVAVIDTGVRYTHEDLAANMWVNPGEVAGNDRDDEGDGIPDDVHGFNSITGTGDPSDDNGHGTHIAGILGAVGNNGVGVCGVAWKVQIMALKFLDNKGDGETSDAIACIDYARKHGAKLINASWGGDEFSIGLQIAISNARNAGIIFVTAAGNERADDDLTLNYPASFTLDNMVVVAATTRGDVLDTSYSNFGFKSVDIAAPGTAIYSTWNTGDNAYSYSSGTSMATPFVTGTLALLKARFPSESYRQLIARLYAAADPLPSLSGKVATGGRLNVEGALGASLIADFSSSALAGSLPLNVRFTNTSTGDFASQSWDFGDGTSPSTDPNPVHTYTVEGNFPVTLSITKTNGLTAQKTRTISVVANYRISDDSFEWIDPVGMTSLKLSDNGVSGALDLPFNFNFYGQVYSKFYIGANGCISFNNASLQTVSNSDLPAVSAPNAGIYPYWDNLYPPSGAIYVGSIGTAPHRRMVVSWVNVPRSSSLSNPLTFQAILHENGSIKFQYQEVHPEIARGAGRRATVGLENETGQVAAKYTYFGVPQTLTNGQAILFEPTGGAGLEVLPGATWDIAGSEGGPFIPEARTYSLRNNGGTPLHWRLDLAEPWLSASLTNGVLDPLGTVDVEVRLSTDINGLAPGTYADTLHFVNLENGLGNAIRPVSLSVNGTNTLLEVSPPQGLTASGPYGGPFSPSVQIYTLINSGDATLNWEASVDQPWAELAATNGLLRPGEAIPLVLQFTDGALTLSPGSYTAKIAVTNLSGTTPELVRTFNLQITGGELKLAVTPDFLVNGFGFVLQGLPNKLYVIESSTNLLDWSPVFTNTTSAGALFNFKDQEEALFSNRYFRAAPSTTE